MGGKPDYEARWEPDYTIVDQSYPRDQEAKVHSHIKCSALGTHLIKLGAAKVSHEQKQLVYLSAGRGNYDVAEYDSNSI